MDSDVSTTLHQCKKEALKKAVSPSPLCGLGEIQPARWVDIRVKCHRVMRQPPPPTVRVGPIPYTMWVRLHGGQSSISRQVLTKDSAPARTDLMHVQCALHNVHSHLGFIIPVVTAMPRPGRYRLHARTMIKHCHRHCHRPPCLAMLPNCAGATPLKMFWILYSIKTGARSCSVGQLSISLLTLFWRL